MRWSVDIEALGAQPGGVILSIGATAFNLQGLVAGYQFEWAIDVQSALDAGLEVDGPTIEWWLCQPGLYHGEKAKRTTLLDALCDLNELMRNAKEVWAKPPSYDLVAIRHAMQVLDIKPSWSHSAELCLRTLLRTCSMGNEVIYQPREDDQHAALADAIYQAEQIISVRNAEKIG